MVYIVMACIVMAYLVTACRAVAYIGRGLYSNRLYIYWPASLGPI